MGKTPKNLPDFSGRFKWKARVVDAGTDSKPNLNIFNAEAEVEIEQNDEFILINLPSKYEKERFRLGVIFEDVSMHKHKNECGKCVSEIKPNGIFYVRNSDSNDNGTSLYRVIKVDKHNRVLLFEGVGNSAGTDPENLNQTTVAGYSVYTRID